MYNGVEEGKKLIAGVENILDNNKLAPLDPETRKLCEQAINTLLFATRSQVASIERNQQFIEDYRETRK